MGSCLTLRNELSKETHVLIKQETSMGSGAPGGNRGGLLCQVAHSLRFYGDGVSFQIFSGQSF